MSSPGWQFSNSTRPERVLPSPAGGRQPQTESPDPGRAGERTACLWGLALSSSRPTRFAVASSLRVRADFSGEMLAILGGMTIALLGVVAGLAVGSSSRGKGYHEALRGYARVDCGRSLRSRGCAWSGGLWRPLRSKQFRLPCRGWLAQGRDVGGDVAVPWGPDARRLWSNFGGPIALLIREDRDHSLESADSTWLTRTSPSTRPSSGRRRASPRPSSRRRRRSGPTPPSPGRPCPSPAGACRRGRTSGRPCSSCSGGRG